MSGRGVIELLVLGATLATAAWAKGVQAHRKSTASRALERYASSRGLLFVPAPRDSPRSGPQVVGLRDDARFVVDLYRLGGEIRTRVSATPLRGCTPVLSVLQRGMFTVGRAAYRFGDETLDHAYVVPTGTAEDVDGLRAFAAALLHLHERCKGVWLASDKGKVSVSWRGLESDPIVLDAARDLTLAVAAWRRSNVPYR